MPAEDTRSLVIGASASGFRRALGATSWIVLEELMLRSTGDGDGCVASVSVRTLVASLGLAKGTVAAAIGRLRDAGLVTALQDRDEAGQFTVGAYHLSVPADALAIALSSAPVASPSTCEPTRRRAPRHADADAIQLALLEPT
jgi:DNA-binding transcriptional ArsR family regulator